MNAQTTTSKHTILWADDDADDLEFIRETLDIVNNDFRLVEASNGQEVLDYLSSLSAPEQFPCLIILDDNMPLLSGRETLSQIKRDEKYSSIPVAIFSTSIGKQDDSFYNHLGALCYTKPDTMKEYQSILSELLTRCNGGLAGAA